MKNSASKWKVVGFGVLASAMFFASVGCSPKQDAQSNGKQDVVKVWTYPVYAKYQDELNKTVADFEAKNPNIKVETEVLSWAEGPQKFDIALNSGNPPDLYFHSVDGKFASTGLELPLESYVPQEVLSDYVPKALDNMKVQGKLYGLPLYEFLWTWGANKKMLTDAGIDYKSIQQNGWTWSQFNDVAKKLTKKNADGSQQYALTFNGDNEEFLEMLTLNAGLPNIVDQSGKFIWNDDKVKNTFSFIKGMLDNGYIPKETVAINPQKRYQMFLDGKAAMISKAIPYYDAMIQQNNKDIESGKKKGQKIDFVLLPIPHEDNSPAVARGGAEGYLMFKQKQYQGDQHEKDVALVLQALTSKEGQSANALGLPIVRNSAKPLFEGKAVISRDNLAAEDVIAKNLPTPVDMSVDLAAKVAQFHKEVEHPAFQALLSGSKTPDQILNDFKTKGQQLLQ